MITNQNLTRKHHHSRPFSQSCQFHSVPAGMYRIWPKLKWNTPKKNLENSNLFQPKRCNRLYLFIYLLWIPLKYPYRRALSSSTSSKKRLKGKRRKWRRRLSYQCFTPCRSQHSNSSQGSTVASLFLFLFLLLSLSLFCSHPFSPFYRRQMVLQFFFLLQLQ